MNRLTIIGNLAKDPELRTTQSGVSVCSFTVAVNRPRRQNTQPEADFFNVTAWRELGENCHKFLAKGRKVAVVGPVSVRTFDRRDGSTGASLEVQASEVEFLSPKGENDNPRPQESAPEPPQPEPSIPAGFTPVEDDELPF